MSAPPDGATSIDDDLAISVLMTRVSAILELRQLETVVLELQRLETQIRAELGHPISIDCIERYRARCAFLKQIVTGTS